MIHRNLIDQFRDKVNESDFVLFSYKNKKGKNQWNCICSAMDWITVAVEYIHSFDKSKKKIQSMEMYSYISSVDVIWEAIQQLHRVLYGTTGIPFEGEDICFSGNKFKQYDNEYFKTIRSCFGAHPINLKDPFNPEAKRFASWSGGHFGEGDYSVILYSNQQDEKDIFLSIYFKEIDQFLEKRYSYLENLMNRIDIQNREFKAKVTQMPIERVRNPLEQLHILATESKRRMDNDYYRSSIEQLILFFETEITCEKNYDMIERYRKALYPLIEEIYQNLSNCNICDLEKDILYQTSRNLPDGHSYWLEKLNEVVYGVGYHPSHWFTKIEEMFNKYFIFEFDTYEELFLLVQAAIYNLNSPPTT